MSGTSFVYNPTRVSFATAQLNWSTAAVNAMLVSTNYSPNPNHLHVSDIPSQAILTRDRALTNKGVTAGGAVYGSIPLMSALANSQPAAAVILYVLGADDAHSQLLYYSSDGPGFPFPLQGFDYFVGFDLSAGGWFQV